MLILWQELQRVMVKQVHALQVSQPMPIGWQSPGATTREYDRLDGAFSAVLECD